MNKLMSNVKDHLGKVFPRPFILLTQSGRIGDNLLRSAAAGGIPVLNVDVRGLKEYMQEVWRSTHIISPYRPAELLDCITVMQRVLTNTKNSNLYHVGNHVEWETAEVFASELNVFHEEGIGPDQLDAIGYSDLAIVYREYLTALDKTSLLLPMQMAEQIPSGACGHVIGILGNVQISEADRVFLKKVTLTETIDLPVPSDEILPRHRYNLSGSYKVTDWPSALKLVSNLECITAQTFETECQGIIRTLLENRIPAEKAVVVCYSQEQSDRICGYADSIGIGCTTAFGCSMRDARVLTVLRTILDWAGDNFDQKHICNMLDSNTINYFDPTGTRLASGKEMMKAILSCKVGWEAKRYKLLSVPVPGETSWEKTNREYAARLFLDWIKLLTERKSEASSVGASVIRLLKLCVDTRNGPHLVAEFNRMIEIISSVGQVISEKIAPTEFLELVCQAAVNDVYDVGDDEPGKLYVCRYHEALTLNRSVFFVPGLTMKAFDKPSGESLLIPDRIREILSPTVPQSCDEMLSRRFALKELMIVRSEDRFFLSWPERDNLNGDKNNPSVIFRNASEVSRPAVRTVIPDSFMMTMDHRLLTGQHSLNTITGFPGISVATVDRLTDNLTISASKLEESLCVCVRRYFLEKILKITPPKELPDQYAGEWLDHKAAGNFLHAVLEQYMNALCGTATRADLSMLKHYFDKQVAALEGKYPLSVYCSTYRRNRQLRRLWKMAVNVAEKYDSEPDRQFVAAEVAFLTSPVKMNFGSHEINLLGKIDRVDYIPSTGKYEIIDYKTKDPSGFTLEGKLQLYLYARAWEIMNPGKQVSEGHYYVLGKGSEGLDDIILSDRKMILDKCARDEREAQIIKALDSLKSPAGCLAGPCNTKTCEYCDYKLICEEVK